MNPDKKPSTVFGERLRALMCERGYTSEKARSGVDLNALAQAAGISHEMARRYAEGLAVPRPQKIISIAAWLKVSPSDLMWSDSVVAIDERALESCMSALSEAQKRTGKTLSTERSAHLVAVLYTELMTGTAPTPQAIDLMLKAAST